MKEDSDIDLPSFHSWFENNAGYWISRSEMNASLRKNFDFAVEIVPSVEPLSCRTPPTPRSMHEP